MEVIRRKDSNGLFSDNSDNDCEVCVCVCVCVRECHDVKHMFDWSLCRTWGRVDRVQVCVCVKIHPSAISTHRR